MDRPDPASPGEITDLAWRDDLTGLLNRRFLRQLLGEEWPNLVAAHERLTLLLLDLDRFKEVNDRHGHLVGDRALRAAASELRSAFRADDWVVRYGGDEFVIVLPGVGPTEARTIAERAGTALAHHRLEAPEGTEHLELPLGFSIGAASCPEDGVDGEQILAVADARLLEEKRSRPKSSAGSTPPGRRVAVGVAIALVLGLVAVLTVRAVRRPPPPPPVVLAPASETPLAAPPVEIVARDEEEIARLRREVEQLRVRLAERGPGEEKTEESERIRALEAQLAAATQEIPAAGQPAADELDPLVGLRLGERRLRAPQELAPSPAAPEPAPAAAAPASPQPVTHPAAPAIEPPRLVRAPRPVYPTFARERRRTATVDLRLRVGADGRVLAVEPLGAPAGLGFDEAARAAALAAEYRPGRRNGEPAEMETTLRIRFQLDSR